jgi:hypothetical protein
MHLGLPLQKKKVQTSSWYVTSTLTLFPPWSISPHLVLTTQTLLDNWHLLYLYLFIYLFIYLKFKILENQMGSMGEVESSSQARV